MVTTKKIDHKIGILLLSAWLWVFHGCTAQYQRQVIDRSLYTQNTTENSFPSAPTILLADTDYADSIQSPTQTDTSLLKADLIKRAAKTKKEVKKEAQKHLTQSKQAIDKCYDYINCIQQKSYKEQWGETLQQKIWTRWIGNRLLLSSTKTKAGKIGLLDTMVEEAHQHLDEAEQHILYAERLGSKKGYKALNTKRKKLNGQFNQICKEKEKLT